MGRPRKELDKEQGKKEPGEKFKVTPKNRDGLQNAKKEMSKSYISKYKAPSKRQGTSDGYMVKKKC